ncbi:hypothetical protein Q6344_04765 [Psychrobacter cibarius]|nr:hypothetical protein Q6344_04765 [Psychrobacter cibarius]
MTNRIGHKLEDKMKLKYVVIKLMLLSLITGCTQLEEVDQEADLLLEEKVNEETAVLLENLNKETIVLKDSESYTIGGSFNTIGIEEDDKTLACINYPEHIKKGVFIDLDTSEVPIIKVQNIEVNPDQINLCNEYFNSQEYTHTAIFSEAFQYTTNGYVFKNEDTKILTKNGKIIGLDLNTDNNSDYLNTCSSIESEHLSIWDNELKEVRLAYAYRRVDADLIETCEDIDYPDVK